MATCCYENRPAAHGLQCPCPTDFLPTALAIRSRVWRGRRARKVGSAEPDDVFAKGAWRAEFSSKARAKLNYNPSTRKGGLVSSVRTGSRTTRVYGRQRLIRVSGGTTRALGQRACAACVSRGGASFPSSTSHFHGAVALRLGHPRHYSDRGGGVRWVTTGKVMERSRWSTSPRRAAGPDRNPTSKPSATSAFDRFLTYVLWRRRRDRRGLRQRSSTARERAIREQRPRFAGGTVVDIVLAGPIR